MMNNVNKRELTKFNFKPLPKESSSNNETSLHQPREEKNYLFQKFYNFIITMLNIFVRGSCPGFGTKSLVSEYQILRILCVG